MGCQGGEPNARSQSINDQFEAQVGSDNPPTVTQQASYARQINDQALFKAAQRIQDRAVIRTGELLIEIVAEKGGQAEN
jgi:hypothetical protein